MGRHDYTDPNYFDHGFTQPSTNGGAEHPEAHHLPALRPGFTEDILRCPLCTEFFMTKTPRGVYMIRAHLRDRHHRMPVEPGGD